MCAIIGIVDRQGRPGSGLTSVADRMSQAVSHRGPDGWGIATLEGSRLEMRSKSAGIVTRDRGRSRSETVVLAHRRLAVIDLSEAAHQPMASPDGRLWIVYNGEIYNHRELRRDLEHQGVRFRSHSDTEVILAFFERERERCLARLRGMFAIAIWDEAAGELWLLRDRFGMKPLYYAQAPGRLLFASETKALLASGLVSADDVDEEGRTAFLQRGSIPAAGSFFHEVRSVPPGHHACWDGHSLRTSRYWSTADRLAQAPYRPARIDDAARQVRTALVESVQAHMVSDVPVGVFLSGGLDSTAVVAAVRQTYNGPLQSMTVTLPGSASLDEADLARDAARRFRTQHTAVEITAADFDRRADAFFDAMDQPTVDGLNTFLVATAAHEAGMKVILSGLGGDELLGGYPSFIIVPRVLRYARSIGRLPGAGRGLAAIARRLPTASAAKIAALCRTPPEVEPCWRRYRALFSEEQLQQLLRDVGRASGPGHRDESRQLNPALFWAIAALEIEEFMAPQLLGDGDIFTMCHGLELRMPFVDHDLLGIVCQTGGWLRGTASSHKMALFRAMGDFLPPRHLRQGKRGFTLPFERWLRTALDESSGTRLGRDMRARLDRPRYRPLLSAFERGRLHWSRLWALYVLERFSEKTGIRWSSQSSSSLTTRQSSCQPA